MIKFLSVYISDTHQRGNQALVQHQQLLPKQGLASLQAMTQKNHSGVQERENLWLVLVGLLTGCSRNTALFAGYIAQQYEYQSPLRSNFHSQPIQILGCIDSADVHYLVHPESVSSTLCSVSIHPKRFLLADGLIVLVALFYESSGRLSELLLVQERHHKQHTNKVQIKLLLHLENYLGLKGI